MFNSTFRGKKYPLIWKFLVFAFLLSSKQTMADQNLVVKSDFAKKLAIFAVNMYSSITLHRPNENMIISPFSIQTCVAMARVGAENETAVEMDRGLGLMSSNVDTMAMEYYDILSTYEQSKVLKIANKIFVDQRYTLQPAFNKVLSDKFMSPAELIDFSAKTTAADTINSWVESKTNHLIKKLVSADDIGDATRLLLLNAIHFKGEWRKKFRADLTKQEDFYLNENDKVEVPMMNVKETFRYAYLSELESSVLELPYADSDLAMLIILPDSRTGLKALEEKLKTTPISDIISKMSSTKVLVKLPKFKTEYSIELTEPLKEMGISRMFTDNAEFGKMLQLENDIKVTKVLHKAFIEVNEEGTEAAAATGMHTRQKRSMPIEPENFIADHPFIYIIAQNNFTPSSVGDQQENKEPFPLFMGTLKAPLDKYVSIHEEL